jgi:hypothetical protein
MLQTAYSLRIVHHTPTRKLRHVGQQCAFAFCSDLRFGDKSRSAEEEDRGTRAKSASLKRVLAEFAGFVTLDS